MNGVVKEAEVEVDDMVWVWWGQMTMNKSYPWYWFLMTVYCGLEELAETSY